ncbi:MAG: tetratricopeptide repeat protein [Bacteroidia bacterium]|nr:tetratricopeptide repeat protein [Bacteroidia bacterium]
MKTEITAPLTPEVMLAYLDEQLSEDDAVRVEEIMHQDRSQAMAMDELAQALDEDPDARQRFLDHQAIWQAALQQQHEANTPVIPLASQAPTARWYQAPWVRAAAVVLMVAIPGSLIFMRKGPQANINDYYTVLNPTTRGVVRGAVPTKAEAEILFETKQYEAAIPALQALIQTYQADSEKESLADEFSLYLANCYIETGRYAEAIDVLSPLAADADKFVQPEALWYLGWARYKKGDVTGAREAFSQSSFNKNQKEDILKSLR